MERLTKRVGDGVRYTSGQYIITCYPKNDNLSDIDKMAVRLCEFEDKIEKGHLFELADIEDTFCCAMIGTTEQGEKYVSLEDYEHDIHKLGKVIKTYRAKLESGQMIELPCIAMVEQGRVDGVFKPTKEAQQFNGRYAVVYIDKSKYSKPLIDVCWSKRSKYDYEQAKARRQELRGGE